MRSKIDTYLENFNKVITLDDINNYYEHSKEELFQFLMNNAVLKQSIAEENNAIINEIIKPLEGKAVLTQEERENVEYFISKIEKGYDSIDNGMLYRLNKILLNDAMNNNDLERIINYIYSFSYYEFILQSSFPREKRNCSWDLILNYVDRYDELSLEGKKYFLRCYGNRMLSKEYSYQLNKEIYDFIAHKKETDPNPQIPYDIYLFAIDKNICTGIELIRNYDLAKEPVPEDLLDGVYAAACRVYNNIQTAANTSVPIRYIYEYTYHASCFHKHIITIDTLLQRLKKMTLVDEERSLQEKASSIIKMNTYWIYYLRYKFDDAEIIKRIIKPTIEQILDFIKTLKPSDYTRNMNSDILSFLKMVSSYYPYEKLEDLYIQITTKRHTPTLIHTESVAELMRMLTEEMLMKNPQFLVGIVDNYDLEYINTHHEEILDLSYRMGMMHDVGKYYCVQFVSINYRRLEDAEFQSIKRHPFYGYNLVKNAVAEPIRDAVLFHHVWHNHQGGYPLEYDQTANQPLVDILSVADSIDAAVDFLGRSYSHRKTLADFVQEFQSFKGTRYAAEVIELFDDPKVFEKVNHFLNVTRQDIVYRAFCEKD